MPSMPDRTWFNFTAPLGTLGSLTAVLTASTKIDSSRLMGAIPREISFDYSFDGKTNDEGPVVYGLSVGLSISEIKEFFAADPQSRAHSAALEESQRKVFVMGILGRLSTGSGDDIPWKTVKWPGWHVVEGETLSFFHFNFGGNALTTGTNTNFCSQIRGDLLDER